MWIDNKRPLTAAAMCIGPLSTLTTNRAMRMSRINCSSEVRLVRSTQFSGVSILRRDCPTITRRLGASAWQNSVITAFESDSPSTRANGLRRMNGGYSSKRGRASPVGSGQRSNSPTVAPAHSAQTSTKQWRFRRIIALRKSGKSRLRPTRGLLRLRHFHSIILKNSRCPTFTSKSSSKPVCLRVRGSLHRIL